MTIDKNTVARIANLARIRLTEEEQNTMAKEFQGILSWVDQLQEVNTDNIPPLTSVVEITLPLREDKVTDGGYADDILANAPKQAAGFFVVPKVVE
ncbi:MAG: Asp-tRNA(Asn)/Glu-tRNA(Gln) amidotransferase subunit GatC [Alphaproteobacteria bacterium]|nr:Asp-tRNA(Asn)/Glu-tRNA(Gln) amidotransferase subunit GatC [Alphaproteobacteria bacterium]